MSYALLTAGCPVQGVIAPLPNGDPFSCFALGFDGVLARLSAPCESGNTTLQGVGVAALQVRHGLVEARRSFSWPGVCHSSRQGVGNAACRFVLTCSAARQGHS